ncbi:hypothetical protein GCM10027075_61720 [Streptomyces heilongjiangensis]
MHLVRHDAGRLRPRFEKDGRPSAGLLRFDKRQCQPRPGRSLCTRDRAETVNFLPRHLHEIQKRNRADPRPRWQALVSAIRSSSAG